MSKITVYSGPMFANKSTNLIEIFYQASRQGQTCICIKPALDNRYSATDIVTHKNDKGQRQKINAATVANITHCDNAFLKEKKADILIIDEISLVEDEWLYQSIKEAYSLGYDIYLSSLNYLANGSVPSILRMLRKEYDLNEVKLRSFCKECKKPHANYTLKRGGDPNKLIEVGGSGIYEPVCHRIFRRERAKQKRMG